MRSINELWGRIIPAETVTDFILPVGISFYTFMALSYLIDTHRGKVNPARSLIHYLAYLSLFAHLVAGPIVRAGDLLPQILHPGDFNSANRWYGTKLIVQGFVKKVLIADNIAPVVNQSFRIAPADGGPLFWWIVVSFFAVQIYCDFSGYTDIARGIARWMGYRFPRNFDAPYIAIGFSDFWERWHITLSSWFRDYVYIPLGGSRKGTLRTICNLWITMLLAGIWHGANWTFIAWGAIHALLISIEHLIRKTTFRVDTYSKRLLTAFFTLVCVNLGWVFFRAPSIDAAVDIARAMFSATSTGTHLLLEIVPPLGWLVVAFFIAWQPLLKLWRSHRNRIRAEVRKAIEICTVSVGIYMCVFFRGMGNAFIYFQF